MIGCVAEYGECCQDMLLSECGNMAHVYPGRGDDIYLTGVNFS